MIGARAVSESEDPGGMLFVQPTPVIASVSEAIQG